MSEYTSQVIDHYVNPRNPGTVAEADGVGQAGDGTNGELLIRISLRSAEGVVEEARFRAFGCSASIASASVATELLAGRSLESAEQLSAEEIEAALGGLPDHKRHCARYAAEAARSAAAAARQARS